MKTKEYTNKLLFVLKKRFPKESVLNEWSTGKKSRDDFNSKVHYAPRLDIAVGPFNINRRIEENNRRISGELRKNNTLIQGIFQTSHAGAKYEFNYYLEKLNINPRCFIAIEIENTGSEKHSIGGIVNASSMGKIGLVIALNESKWRLLPKLLEYFQRLKGFGKLEGDFSNVLVIRADELLSALK